MTPSSEDPFILAYGGRLHHFRSLVGARPDFKTLNDRSGDFLIHHAARGGNVDVVEFLLKRGVPPDLPGASGATPMHCAAAGGHREVLDLLVRHSVRMNPVNKNGMTPLHVAAGEGRLDLVRHLVSRGSCVRDTDRFGRLALHYAAGADQVGVIEFLAILDPGSIERPDSFGMRPLHWGCYFEAEGVCDFLSRWKVNSTRRDIYGRQAGYFLCLSTKPTIRAMADWLPSDSSICIMPDVHTSVTVGDIERIRMIPEGSADLFKRDSIGRTPLHVAAFTGNRDVYEILKRKGASISDRDDYGWTPRKLLSYRMIRE